MTRKSNRKWQFLSGPLSYWHWRSPGVGAAAARHRRALHRRLRHRRPPRRHRSRVRRASPREPTQATLTPTTTADPPTATATSRAVDRPERTARSHPVTLGAIGSVSSPAQRLAAVGRDRVGHAPSQLVHLVVRQVADVQAHLLELAANVLRGVNRVQRTPELGQHAVDGADRRARGSRPPPASAAASGAPRIRANRARGQASGRYRHPRPRSSLN